MSSIRTDPYTRAERCFALARSTTFPGERDNAIVRGIAIAEKAGLDLDHFDIPGRVRRKTQYHPQPGPIPSQPFRGERAPRQYASSDVADLMRTFHARMASMRADIAEEARRNAEAARRREQAEALSRLEEAIARAAAAADLQPDETLDQAQRRAFDRAVEEAKARDAKRESHYWREAWRQAEEGLGSSS